MNSGIKKKISILLLIDVIILAGFIVIALFLYNLIQKQSSQYLEISKSLKLTELKREQFSIYKSRFENNKSNFEKINNLFLNKADILKFFNFIEKISSDYKLYQNISVINPDEKFEDFLKMQISLNGSFSNFMKFLASLENAPYLLQIEDLKIRKLTSAELIQLKQMPMLEESDVNSVLIIKVFIK